MRREGWVFVPPLLGIAVFVVVLGAHGGITRVLDARSQSTSHVDGGDRGKTSSSSVVPSLTAEQKLLLENRILARDLAQARLDALVKEYTVPGYNLMGDGSYVKQPAEKSTVTP